MTHGVICFSRCALSNHLHVGESEGFEGVSHCDTEADQAQENGHLERHPISKACLPGFEGEEASKEKHPVAEP